MIGLDPGFGVNQSRGPTARPLEFFSSTTKKFHNLISDRLELSSQRVISQPRSQFIPQPSNLPSKQFSIWPRHYSKHFKEIHNQEKQPPKCPSQGAQRLSTSPRSPRRRARTRTSSSRTSAMPSPSTRTASSSALITCETTTSRTCDASSLTAGKFPLLCVPLDRGRSN